MPSPSCAKMSVHSMMRCDSHASRRAKTNGLRIHAPRQRNAKLDRAREGARGAGDRNLTLPLQSASSLPTLSTTFSTWFMITSLSVLRRKYSFDHFHCFTMSFLTSSNGSLVFINSHENPVFKHIHIVTARKLIRIYSPIHMMAPGDNPRPTGMSSESASRMSCVQ